MSFVSCCDFNYFSEILDLSPECHMAGTFPISLEYAHKSAHRLQQVDLLWMVTLEDGNLDSYGCNPILVLIVLIVTHYLNEAKSFSLFNATQILSIAIWKTQGERPAVVFIVLIVLTVTLCLNEAEPFSLFNTMQILQPEKETDRALQKF